MELRVSSRSRVFREKNAMALPDTNDEMMVPWSNLLLVVLRAFSVCVLVVVSSNIHLLFRCAVQVQCGNARRIDARRSSRTFRHTFHSSSTQLTDCQGSRSRPTPPPPPYSLTPSLSPPPSQLPSHPTQAKPSQTASSSLTALYENIMSADAQTIRVLQDTLQAQQETIRAQGLMIQKMREVIEEMEWNGEVEVEVEEGWSGGKSGG
jgi:hypothetical protein